MQTLLLSLLFFIQAFSSQVTMRDLYVQPCNRDQTLQFRLVFNLQTSISTSDLIKIISPVNLTSISSVTIQEMITECDPNPKTLTVNLQNPDTLTIYLNFTDSSNNAYALTAGYIYNLTFSAALSSPTTETPRFVGPFQVYSVSDMTTTAIVFDSNPSFGFFYLAGDVGILSTVTLTALASNATFAGFSHPVDIVFFPAITVNASARVIGTFTNTNYSFDSCIPINETGFSFFPSKYTVTIKDNKFTVFINQTFLGSSNTKYKIRCYVRNPLTTGQTTSFDLATAYGGMELYVEKKTVTTTLAVSSTTNAYTTPISWNSALHSVRLGWGAVASETTSLDVLAIFKDPSATEKWYQTVKITFGPTATLTTQSYTVIFYTVSDTSFVILRNSIQHTLPAFDSVTPVSCDLTTTGAITCKGVGALAAGVQYYIAFRFNLASTATATTTNFGKIDVYSNTNPQYLIVQTGAKTMKTATILTNQALTSTVQNVAYTKTQSGSVTYNYINAGTLSNLFLKFKYFTSTLIDIATRNPYNKGIEFYTSFSLPTASSTGCGITGLTTSTDLTFTTCEVTNVASTYTILRFRIGQLLNTANVGTVFTSSANTGEIYFKNVTFDSSKLSSLSFIDENIFDFYARWISYATTGTTITTLGTQFFFNSLVYQSGSLSGLSISPAFMTSTNDGSYFPTLIRVSGNFTSNETTSSAALLLFFNGLTPLNTNNPCFGNLKLTCKFKEADFENTQTDSLPDYTSSKIVIVNFDTGFNTTPFNFYIPVYNNASISNLGFFAVLGQDTGNGIFTQSEIYRTTFSRRFNKTSFSSAPALTVGTASTSTMTLNLPSLYGLGSIINTNISTGFQLSSGNNQGAHYSICAIYNFYSWGLTSTLATSTLSSMINSCVNMTYKYLGKDIHCRICPIHSVLTGVISLDNFKLPTMTGIDAGNYSIQTSLDDGTFNFSVIDTKSSNMNATIITFYEIYAPGIMITTAGQRVTARAIFSVDVPTGSYLIFTSTSTIDLTPSATMTSCYTNFVTKTCTVSQADTSSLTVFFSSTDNSIFSAGLLYEFSFFVDLTSVTTVSNVSYNASVFVVGNSGLVVQQISNTSKVITEIAASATSTFPIKNLNYTFGNMQTTTTISMYLDLPGTMPLLKDRYITCNFNTIAKLNSDSNITYHCLLNEGNQQSLNFQSCDSSNLLSFKAVARGYVPKVTVRVSNLKLISFVAPPTITCSLYETTGTLMATSQTAFFPVISAPRQWLASDINMYAQFAVPGSVANLTLMTIFRYNDVAVTDFIYIYFPSYYPPRLGYESISCALQGTKIKCDMIQDYVLRITSFPGVIAKLTRMFISIFGVLFPKVPTTNTEYFFVAYDNDNDPSRVIQSGYIPPIYNIKYPTYLRAGFSLGLALSNVMTSLIFTIDTTVISPGFVVTGSTILIDMPNLFTSFELDSSSAITITNSLSGKSISSTMGILGGRISLKLMQSFESTGSYVIRISNILTPTSIVCNFPMPSISILASNNFDLLYMSSFNTIDSPYSSFLDSTGTNLVVKSLAWFDKNGNRLVNLTVYDGVYSETIYLGVTDGSLLQTSITVAERSGKFVSLPSSLSVSSGAVYLPFRVATIVGLATNTNYQMIYQISNTINLIYRNPPALNVYLSSGLTTIIPSNFTIPSGGYSLPVLFDLSQFNGIPRQDLTITASLYDKANGYFFIDSNVSITLTPSSYVGSFIYSVFANVTKGRTLRVQYALSGTNKGSYQFSSSIAYAQITTAITTSPKITSFMVLTPSSPISQAFQITTTQAVNLYYFNIRAENFNTMACDVLLKKATIPATYSLTDPTQAQYGFLKIDVANAATVFTIGNLLSKTTYTAQFCPYNQGALFGTPFTSTYTTKDNLQMVYSLNFIFTNAITDYQLASLCCYFNQLTLLPDPNIISLDRDLTCSDLKSTNAINKVVARIFSITVFGDRTSADVNNSLSNVLSWNFGNLTNPSSSYYQSFFSFLGSIGLGGLFSNSTISLSSVSYAIEFFSTTSVLVTQDAFIIQSVATTKDGTVYAVLYRGGDTVPNQNQIKAGYNVAGRYYYSVLTMNVKASTFYNISFSGLNPDISYTISYFAESGNIVGYIRQTNVYSVNGTTLAYALYSELGTPLNVILLLMAILAYIIM